MVYDLHQLRDLARANLAIAGMNLQRDGFVQTCGLVWTHQGLSHIVSMPFESVDDKRRTQEAFRAFLRHSKALAAAVIMEAWIKVADPEEPLDLYKSVADMPGRKDAIVIEIRSAQACFVLAQVFSRHGEALTVEEPVEMNHSAFWTSEWLDGVWSDRPISLAGTIHRVSQR